MRGADRRVPGKGQLLRGSKDAEVAGISWIPRRLYEDRLGEVELGRDPLHFVLGQFGSLGEHRELIPAEGTIGEDVERVKVQSFRHGYRIPDKSNR